MDMFTFDIQGIRTYEEYELNNTVTRDLEEPWLDNGVPYQLCDHICEPYRFKNGITKWPTYSSDIDGFCNGGELPGMRPYANFKTEKAHDPYLEINSIFGRNYDTSNASNTQDNQGHEERRDDPTLEPSVCKIRRFEMMKYSFNVDEEYIAIKESDYLNHSRTSFGFQPFQFSYPPRKLIKEEMLYKFIDEERQEYEEMGAFIREFKTTNKLLLKERHNSFSELKFKVYGLSKAINDAQLSNYEVTGVTTRGGKTIIETIRDTNYINKEPPVLHHDKSIEPNEVLV
ncbi:hypothetical protein Tco_0327895 [Tanacetum coccineum]